MSDDQTPILTRIDRQLYAARSQPDTQKALAEYRKAYLQRDETATGSTGEESYTGHTNPAYFEDCTLGTCRAVRVKGGLEWICLHCPNRWTTLNNHIPVGPDPRRWLRPIGLALALLGAAALWCAILLLWTAAH